MGERLWSGGSLANLSALPLPAKSSAAPRELRAACTQQLPPFLAQVSLRVRELLLGGNPRHQVWACCYLWHATLATSPRPGPGLDSMWQWVCRGELLRWVAQAAADEGT